MITSFRYLRTATVDGFYFFEESYEPGDSRGALADLQLLADGNCLLGRLLLRRRATSDQLNEILDQVNGLAVFAESWEDFILDIYRVREIASYSRLVSDSERLGQPVTRRDLGQLQKSIRMLGGRSQAARGQLNELLVREYFSMLGYDAFLATAGLDQRKVDVVAEREKEQVFAQVKLGIVSMNEMRSVVASVAEITSSDGKNKVAAIVARGFPKEREWHRRRLEDEFSITVICIFTSEILQSLPKYRKAIS